MQRGWEKAGSACCRVVKSGYQRRERKGERPGGGRDEIEGWESYLAAALLRFLG